MATKAVSTNPRPLSICSVEGCDRKVRARGFCIAHWKKWRRYGDPLKGAVKKPPKLCSVKGCEGIVDARGLCRSHYKRKMRHGDPLFSTGHAPRGALQAFFRDKVLSCESDDCLIWPFSRGGYPKMSHEGKRLFVHRLVCEARHGPPPTKRHQAAHTCGKGHEGCVNPKHLRWATVRENVADTITHGTRNRGERHGAAKLTEDQVREIRALKGRYTQKEVADMFSVSAAAVSDIMRRTNWAWLD